MRETGKPVLLAVSGKITAGKDFIGEKVMERLAPEAVHLAFAQPLKDEVSALIEAMRGVSREEATRRISAEQGVFEADARGVVEILFDAAQDGALSGWSRTAEVRAGLQYWATDVRRREEPEYWVERAMEMAQREIEAGRSVFFTDVRFPNEAEGARSAGFTVVRLLVSPEVQARRLLERDGVVKDAAALTHYSETALDKYEGFDLVVSNDGEDPEVVVEEILSLWQ